MADREKRDNEKNSKIKTDIKRKRKRIDVREESRESGKRKSE